ncbi:MAG: hypothetical protein J5J06_01795 [Phycisphaerae bacterium]|nr:hypothetical protein [Phycisphaerae bacterium]
MATQGGLESGSRAGLQFRGVSGQAMDRRAAVQSVLLGMLLLVLGGCAGPHMPSGNAPRIGRVYCLRGLMDVFSLGLNDLARELRKEGVRAADMSGSRWRSLAVELEAEAANGEPEEPIVLVGHSYGADNAVRLAWRLKKAGIDVDLLLLLDATAPPPIPDNVIRCVHYYKPTVLGAACPICFAGNPVVLAAGNERTVLLNTVISRETLGADAVGVGHFNVDAAPAIHRACEHEIMAICVLRSSRATQGPHKPDDVAAPVEERSGS